MATGPLRMGCRKGEYIDQEESQAAGFDRPAHQLEGNFSQAG